MVLFGLNTVDEFDRSAFSVLLPNIRRAFGLDIQGVLTLTSLVALVGVLVGPVVGLYADRLRRVRIAALGGAVWGVFSVFTGLASNVLLLGVARAGSSLGKTVNQPTHNSLLADYYPPEVRVRVYYAHGIANPVGQFVAPLLAGFIAAYLSWRVPFVLLSVPTFVFVVLALRLREPQRGAMDFPEVAVGNATPEPPPTWRQGVKILWGVRSYRRVCFSLPFLAFSTIGLQGLISLFWDEIYGLDERARGLILAFDEPFSVAGLVVAAMINQRLINRRPAMGAYFLAAVATGTALLLAVQALSPSIGGLPVAVGASFVRGFVNSMILPGLFALGSLVLPPTVRSLGFAAAPLWFLPGVVVVPPIIGGIADSLGIDVGMLALLPVYLLGALIMASGARLVEADRDRLREKAEARISG